MARAKIYYYPSGFGHIGISVSFPKEEVPIWSEYSILLFSQPPEKTSHWEVDCKLEARKTYKPALFLKSTGEFSIYGFKEGIWQETLLTDLSQEDKKILESLSFPHSHHCAELYKIPTSDLLYRIMQTGHPEFIRTEYFFDFGGAYDLESNCTNRGEPIEIVLPPTNTHIREFFDSIDESKYTINNQPSQLAYNLFTQNCAHATQQILYFAGYLSEKPSDSFALLPFTVAWQASQFARLSRAAFRKKLIETQCTDSTQRINALIELSMQRLSDNIDFKMGHYLGNCSTELACLSKINYDGSYESIERLLHASEVASSLTIQELNDCIALVDPELCFKASITRLEQAGNRLDCSKDIDAIATGLKQELVLFQNKTNTHETFTKNCSQLLEKANPLLKDHGAIFVQILKNIALAIVGLVAIFLVAACINQSNTGNFLFFSKPSATNISTEIQGYADRLKP